MSKKFRFLSCLIAVFALAMMAVSPVAFAGPGKSDEAKGKQTSEEKGNGKADKESEDTVTEDNDDDGVPNSPDPEGDADNKHPSGKDKHEEAGGSGNQGKATSDPDDDGRGPDRSNGGVDQPGGTGGADKLDQDGNNGCGNDDDFEDDNEGLCLGPSKRQNDRPKDEVLPKDENKPKCPNGSNMPASGICEGPKVCPDGSEMPAHGRCDEVGGEVIERCPDGSAMPASGNVEDCDVQVDEQPSTPDDDVLGERIERDEQAAAPTVLGVRLSPALNEPVEVAGAVLPFTGGDALIFLAAGLALIGAGALALRFRSNES